MLKNSGKQWKILGNSAQNLSKNSDSFWLGEKNLKIQRKNCETWKNWKTWELRDTIIGELGKIWEDSIKHWKTRSFQSFSEFFEAYILVFPKFSWIFTVSTDGSSESSVAFHYFPEFFNIFQNIPITQFYKIFSSFPEIFIEFSTTFQNFLDHILSILVAIRNQNTCNTHLITYDSLWPAPNGIF